MVHDLYSRWIQSFLTKNKIAQETMKRLQKFVQPDQIPSIIRTDNSLEFIRDCEDQCWNHGKSTPYRSELMELPSTQFPGSQKGTSPPLVQLAHSEKVVVRSNGMLMLLAKHTRQNWQTESQRIKEDVKTPVDGTMIPFGAYIFFEFNLFKRHKPSASSRGRRCFQEYSSENALISGGGWTGDLIIADGHDIENNVASKVHVNQFKSQRSWNQEVAGSIHISLRRRLPQTRRSPTTSKLNATRESRAWTREEYPPLRATRGVTLCSA